MAQRWVTEEEYNQIAQKFQQGGSPQQPNQLEEFFNQLPPELQEKIQMLPPEKQQEVLMQLMDKFNNSQQNVDNSQQFAIGGQTQGIPVEAERNENLTIQDGQQPQVEGGYLEQQSYNPITGQSTYEIPDNKHNATHDNGGVNMKLSQGDVVNSDKTKIPTDFKVYGKSFKGKTFKDASDYLSKQETKIQDDFAEKVKEGKTDKVSEGALQIMLAKLGKNRNELNELQEQVLESKKQKEANESLKSGVAEYGKVVLEMDKAEHGFNASLDRYLNYKVTDRPVLKAAEGLTASLEKFSKFADKVSSNPNSSLQDIMSAYKQSGLDFNPKDNTAYYKPTFQPINGSQIVGDFKSKIAQKETGAYKNPYIAIAGIDEKDASTHSFDELKSKAASSGIGKYQFIWNIHKNDIKRVTGISKPDDFRYNPQAQEQFMDWFRDNTLLPQATDLKQRYQLPMSIDQIMAMTHLEGKAGLEKKIKAGTLKTSTMANNFKNASPLDYASQFKNGGIIKKYPNGGKVEPIYTDNPKDKRLQAYNDSLDLYNNSEEYRKLFEKNFNWIKYGKTLDENKALKQSKQVMPSFQYGNPNIRITNNSVSAQYPYQIYPDELKKINFKNKPIGWKPELKYGEKYNSNALNSYSMTPVYKKPVQPVIYKKKEVEVPVPKVNYLKNILQTDEEDIKIDFNSNLPIPQAPNEDEQSTKGKPLPDYLIQQVKTPNGMKTYKRKDTNSPWIEQYKNGGKIYAVDGNKADFTKVSDFNKQNWEDLNKQAQENFGRTFENPGQYQDYMLKNYPELVKTMFDKGFWSNTNQGETTPTATIPFDDKELYHAFRDNKYNRRGFIPETKTFDSISSYQEYIKDKQKVGGNYYFDPELNTWVSPDINENYYNEQSQAPESTITPTIDNRNPLNRSKLRTPSNNENNITGEDNTEEGSRTPDKKTSIMDKLKYGIRESLPYLRNMMLMNEGIINPVLQQKSYQNPYDNFNTDYSIQSALNDSDRSTLTAMADERGNPSVRSARLAQIAANAIAAKAPLYTQKYNQEQQLQNQKVVGQSQYLNQWEDVNRGLKKDFEHEVLQTREVQRQQKNMAIDNMMNDYLRKQEENQAIKLALMETNFDWNKFTQDYEANPEKMKKNFNLQKYLSKNSSGSDNSKIIEGADGESYEVITPKSGKPIIRKIEKKYGGKVVKY